MFATMRLTVLGRRGATRQPATLLRAPLRALVVVSSLVEVVEEEEEEEGEGEW